MLHAAGLLLCLLTQQDSQDKRLKDLEDTVQTQQKRLDELEKRKDPGGAATQSDRELRVFWDKGIQFQTADGAFSLSIGGRVQDDFVWISESNGIRSEFGAAGHQQDGTEFRRVRIEFEGTIYERFLFELSLDFSEGTDVELKDAWIGVQDLPLVGRVSIGYQKIPFGLESLSSSNALTFMERGLGTEFLERRASGVRFMNAFLNERLTVSAGAFRNTDDIGFAAGDGESAVAARVTGLPWFGDKTHLFHLGLSVEHLSPTGNSLRFRERPEVHMANRLVDTGGALADVSESALFLRAEAALVFGPLSLQAEYTHASVNTESGFAPSNPRYNAFYVYASYFLTGESRRYKTDFAAFSTVTPKADLLHEGGWGAWELAVRYSTADLSDLTADPDRQKLRDITVGLNWYWNANMYVMFNYVHSDLKDVGALHAFMIRIGLFF